MQINTKYLGKMQIKEEDIILFEEGIPGFENLKKFIILSLQENAPFFVLQSIEEESIAFPILPTFEFFPDYDIEITEQQQRELQIESIEQVAVYSIVVIPEEIEKMTANLQAPLVININNRKGKQIILEKADYPIKYYIYDFLRNSKEEK